MYDRRPASRVAGTPTVAALTPAGWPVVLRGSCQMAISSPLARAKGPFAKAAISWMAEATSSETGHSAVYRTWSYVERFLYFVDHAQSSSEKAPRGHHRDRVGKCHRRRGQVDGRGHVRARARDRRRCAENGREAAHHLPLRQEFGRARHYRAHARKGRAAPQGPRRPGDPADRRA